jgi:hypothetical protein
MPTGYLSAILKTINSFLSRHYNNIVLPNTNADFMLWLQIRQSSYNARKLLSVETASVNKAVISTSHFVRTAERIPASPH